jgi:endonuclease-3
MTRPKRSSKTFKRALDKEVSEEPEQGLPTKRVRTYEESRKVKLITEILDYLYPDPPVPLNGETDFQLLVAIVLSAQTTDVAVNACTAELFKEAPHPQAMVELGLSKVTGLIQTLGLYKNKAKSVVGLSQLLVDSYEGNVDNVETKEQLMTLPGVGPKTASVFLSQARGVPSFAVDTHVHRLALRWGLSKEKRDANVVQRDLEAIFPRERWSILHLQFIYYGREHCVAKTHRPRSCPVCSALRPREDNGSGDADGCAEGFVGAAELVQRCVEKASADPPSPVPKNILIYSRRKHESPDAKVVVVSPQRLLQDAHDDL